MVDIVTPENRCHYREHLDEMHRQRYRVFVESAGWDIPGVQTGYDKDAFDTDDTIYLLEIEPETNLLLASVRFNPTTKPHMMTEVFSDQCELLGIPTGEHIWEGSRYALERSRVSTEGFARLRIRMGIAMTEFCLQSDIRQMTWLTHKMLYGMALKRWPTAPLGLPKYFASDDATYIAAISDMTKEALAGLRASLPDEGQVTFAYLPLDALSGPVARAASRPLAA